MVIIYFILIFLFINNNVFGFIIPDPATFESVVANNTDTITWIATKGTGNGTIYYRFYGNATNTQWQLSRTNIVSGLLKNTRYYEKTQMSNDFTGETNTGSTNAYCYTLLSAPQDSDLVVTPISYDKIQVAVTPPVNADQGLTGCQFSNFSGQSQGGTNSPPLTGIYVYTNTNLFPNTKYGYKVRYKNGDGIWTLCNPNEITNYTYAKIPSAPTITAKYDIVTNYFTIIDINPNGNPSYTRFAIYCTNNGKWLQGDGTTGISPVWHTESWWESSFRNYHTNLTPNTYYGYQVYAINENGVQTSPSPVGKDITPPAVPTGVVVTEVNDDFLCITWNATPGALDYKIYFVNDKNESLTNYNFLALTSLTTYTDDRDGGIPAIVTGLKVTNTSATDTSRLRVEWNICPPPAPSSNYFYRIRARNSNGKEGAFSAISTGASNVTPVISYYKVYRDTLYSNNSFTTIFTDTGLNANTLYHYYVKAVSSDKLEGPKSIEVSNYTAIQTPTGVVFVTLSTSFITISGGGSFNNLNIKNSGLYFSNLTNSSNSGWIQTNIWTSYNLSQNKCYGFRIKARNAEGLETPWCPVYNRFTLCKVPLSPYIGEPFTNALVVIIKSNNNPLYTEYAISNIVTHQFVQPDGSLNNIPAWQTYAQWGATQGITNFGLAPSVNYSYTVKARNGDGIETVASVTSSWKYTLAKPPSNLRSPSHTTTNIVLEWHNNGASFFAIECALDQDGSPGPFIYLKDFNDKYSATNFNHTGLWPNVKYWYRVSGYNGDGIITSSTSNICILTVTTNPEPPSNFTGVAVSTDAILWEWKDNSFSENYFIVMDNSGSNISGLLPFNTTSYLETGLEPNTLYERYVVASNEYGKSEDSNTYVCATLSPPAYNLQVTLFSQSYEGSAAKLEWNGHNVSSYGVERSVSINGEPDDWKCIASNITGNSYIDSTVIQSNTYFYRIASFNQQGVMNTNRSTSVYIFIPKPEKVKMDIVSDNYITSDDEKVEILYKNSKSGKVTIKIYSVSGRLVKTIIDSDVSAGVHYFKWYLNNNDNKRVSRGIYFIHISGPNGVNEIKKIFVVK